MRSSEAPVSEAASGNGGGSSSSRSKTQYLWLGLASLLFLLQTVPYLSYRWVTDESWYAGPAYSIAHGNGLRDPAIGPNDIENHLDARPPGTALVIATAFKAFGAGPVPARLGSMLAGLMTIWLIFWLTRDLLGWQGACIASFLVATDNLIVLAARTARPESLTVMAVLCALLALKQYARLAVARWAFITGLLMTMATMFHVTVLGYIVAGGLLLIALDLSHRRFALRGALLYTAGFLTGLVPFATWILTAPLGSQGFKAEFLSRAVNSSLLVRLVGEGRRYADIFGFHTIHTHGLESLPVRLPIPLCFLAATVLLWKLRRTWFYVELVLLIPSVLWLVYTVNKSSRYIAILAPIFAVTIAAAVVLCKGHRLGHRLALGLACIVIAAQAGANLLLLHAAGKANYEQVGTELRALIPAGETAYGSITFWLDFRNRSYISYERTTPWMAIRQYHARYFILGDRVMLNGQTGEAGFYQQLNHDLAEVTAQSTLVGHVLDPYYGDLAIYRLNPWPVPSDTGDRSSPGPALP